MKLRKILKHISLFFILTFCIAQMSWAIEIQKFTLENGAKVLLVERHEIPIVDINVSFDAGNRRDTKDKIGVAGFTGSLMDTGAGSYNEEAIREKISDLSVSINSYAALENAGLNIRSLSRSNVLNPTIELANLILTRPNYDEKILTREKERAILRLKQAETRPGFLANKEITLLNYGQHPYGFSSYVTPESIQAVTRDDILKFYQQHYQVGLATIAIVGDVNRNQAKKIAEKLLAGLPNKQTVLAAIPAVQSYKAGVTKYIKHPATQATIQMGLPVIQYKDADYFPLVVGNYILGGGGFDGRLMKTLRDQYGYTYGAYSYFSPLQQKGPFNLSFSTQKKSAQVALIQAKKVLSQFIAEGPTEKELQQAKDNIIGGFPLRFDNNDKLLNYLTMIGLYDLPLDYLDTYVNAVDKVSIADIKQVWQRRIKTQDVNVVVVGGQ